jgi:hypothetical protein
VSGNEGGSRLTDTRFNLEKQLGSIRVDKDLLTRLEEYFLSELARMSGVSPKHFPKVFSISITDGVGTEVLHSIKDHRPVQLPDSTQRVAVSYNTSLDYDDELAAKIDVNLSFGREDLYTAVKVNCTGPNARQVAISIEEAVLLLLEPHWTHNRLFHPFVGWEVLLFVLMFFAAATGFTLIASGQISAASWLLLLTAALLAYFYAAKRLKPWSSFDSRSDRANEEVWRWFKFGVLTFLVFGSLLTLLRKRLFGF